MLRLDAGDADIERAERYHPSEANRLQQPQQIQLIVSILKVAVAALAGLSSAATLNAQRRALPPASICHHFFAGGLASTQFTQCVTIWQLLIALPDVSHLEKTHLSHV